MARLLIFLRASADLALQGGEGKTQLLKAATQELERIRKQTSEGTTVRLYSLLENDPFSNTSTTMKPANVTIEIEQALLHPVHLLKSPLAGLSTRFEGLLDSETSILLVTHARSIFKGPPQPFCYRYLMKRRTDYASADYLDHYVNHHYKYGHQTPGVTGYIQHYVDNSASKVFASTAGLTYQEFDSISELHLPSVDEFITAISASEVPIAAAQDEGNFVDGPASQMFVSLFEDAAYKAK